MNNITVLNFKAVVRLKCSRWRAMAGLDFHVMVTLLFRAWAIIAGAATVFLLPLWLTPTEQGYYFTFASVLALQIFFELGLNQIVMQLVSHEVAHLTETAEGRLVGNDAHLDRLSSLAHLIDRWYGAAGLLFALIGGSAGAVFFLQKGTEPMSGWLGVWVVLVCATAVNLWLSPGLAVMEGCGKVGQVARLRLVQSVLGYAGLWVVLLSGAGLWAATTVPVVSAMCTSYWIKANGDMLGWLSSRATDVKNQLRWRADVLPLQWRIALSWVSGYLIFNLFTPMVFSHHGAIEAGRLGMALTVFSAASMIGMSWVNAKAPNFTIHIARGEYSALNILFKTLAIRSIVVTVMVSSIVIGIALFFDHLNLPLMSRIASSGVLVALALITVANSAVFSAAIYMRAYREEPMLPVSLVTGLLTALAVYFGSRFGVFQMVILYASITIFVTLPWTIWLFSGYYKRSALHI